MMVDLFIWEAAALALVCSLFCRASHTSKGNTRRDIRWAFTFLGVVAIVATLAPFWGYDPDPLTIALLAAIAVVQITTAYHWRRGVPAQFRRTS
jgi:asparagine N-glycosylation enzyme membrane subunit Stt3